MARRRVNYSGNELTADPIIQLWVLRILILLGAHREFVCSHGFSDDTLARAVGLEDWLHSIQSSYDHKIARVKLRELHQLAEYESENATLPSMLSCNIKNLADLAGLSQTDCRILEFVISIHTERLLDNASDYLGSLSSVRVFRALSVILDLPESEIRDSLSAEGILSRSGLLSVDRTGTNNLRAKLDLLSDSFADLMVTSEADPVSLLRGILSAAGPSRLTLADYTHIESSLDILKPYLRHAILTGRRGVNIFLHGAPGTGKSELARALAVDLNSSLFEVASEDVAGDAVSGERRLRAFRAAQSFFAKSQAIILFDEVEDVFNDGDRFFGRKSTAQVRKAWINRILEENPVPTLWLSNSIDGLDPAFIRRFDMVFELPVPPKKHRERILRESSGDLLDGAAISRIVDAEGLAPAVVSRATSVACAIRKELGDEGAVVALECLISNTLEAQGHRPLIRHDPNRLTDTYDPKFIHSDTDLSLITSGFFKVSSARLCLYGPPGTGKTAYGRWLAQELDIPLMVKRASDLLSPYIGESEQNIARAFSAAAKEGALLLIDEVDTFLQDRRGAQRSWEVSLVNEMLTQIESFPGMLIASTNLIDGFDQAALRRFDMKVKFDFLRTEQAWELLQRYCRTFHLDSPPHYLREQIAGLSQLTPGDFAVLSRQHRFRPFEQAAELFSALKAEVAMKGQHHAPIGFF